MSGGRFWMIKCPSCGKAVFRFQDEPPEQARCNCGCVIPGPDLTRDDLAAALAGDHPETALDTGTIPVVVL